MVLFFNPGSCDCAQMKVLQCGSSKHASVDTYTVRGCSETLTVCHPHVRVRCPVQARWSTHPQTPPASMQSGTTGSRGFSNTWRSIWTRAVVLSTFPSAITITATPAACSGKSRILSRLVTRHGSGISLAGRCHQTFRS